MRLLDKPGIVFPGIRDRLPLFSEDTKIKIAKGAILFGVVALSAVVGLLTTSTSKQLIAAGLVLSVVAVAGALFLSEHLTWGLILLMVTAIYTPFSLPTGTASRIVDSMVVTGVFLALWVLRMLVVQKRFTLVKSPTNLPLLGFILVSVISWGWSVVFRDPQVVIWDTFPFVQLASTLVMILLPGALLFVGNFARDKRMLVAMTILMIIGGAIGVAGQFLGRNFVNAGGLMAMWTMALTVALILFSKTLPLWLKAVLAGIAGAWVLYSFILNISWVAGWLPGLLAVAVMLFMRDKRLFLISVAGVIVLVGVFYSYYNTAFQTEQNSSGVSRVAAWEVNWKVTGEHLLFGTGPGGYAAYYMTYYPTEAMATHNNYIDIIAQTGLIGLILWLWFFGALLWQGYRLAVRLRGRGDFYECLANAAFAGTIACMVIAAFGDWMIPFAYTQTIAGFDYAVYNWIFMGTIVAVNNLTRDAGNA